MTNYEIVLSIYGENADQPSSFAYLAVFDQTKEILTIFKDLNGLLSKPMPLPFLSSYVKAEKLEISAKTKEHDCHKKWMEIRIVFIRFKSREDGKKDNVAQNSLAMVVDNREDMAENRNDQSYEDCREHDACSNVLEQFSVCEIATIPISSSFTLKKSFIEIVFLEDDVEELEHSTNSESIVPRKTSTYLSPTPKENVQEIVR
ncbi:hypothetical protein Cgig2_027466 [Carnegiea gigantea]|uniref:Uncharacterized protein n=1 Tax=Carnegiea gigantea TaxID=171969 RepID=A0A9Q1QLU1_9CARY|nr:hypothetical protein Cgig2_027466 [Carnegiea gigantea]